MHSKDRKKQWVIPWSWPFFYQYLYPFMSCSHLHHQPRSSLDYSSNVKITLQSRLSHQLFSASWNLWHWFVSFKCQSSPNSQPQNVLTFCAFLAHLLRSNHLSSRLTNIDQSYILRPGINLSVICVSDLVFSVHWICLQAKPNKFDFSLTWI